MPPASKVYRVRQIPEEVEAGPGGWLEAEHWKQAEALVDFRFPWIAMQAPATTFRALRNSKKFFFCFEIADADLVLDDSDDPVKRVTGSDRAELFFATGESLDPYYCLEIDPRGYVFDYRGKYYREFSPEWTWPGLETAARIGEGGYVVAGCLPMESFEALGLLQEGETCLRAGVYRAEFSHAADGTVVEDWISWVDPGTENPDFHVPGSFGEFWLEKE